MNEVFLSTENIPVAELKNLLFTKKGIRLFVKRDDLIHPQISGNKWRKLKYNIEEMRRQNKNVMLTFGGAYSNHILATAAVGKEIGFKTIGIIRGEEAKEKSTVLRFAEQAGMHLHFISRADYKKKTTTEVFYELKKSFGEFYLVPEGGGNELGVMGCGEIVQEISFGFTHICCATGTGATLAGIALSLTSGKTAIGFCVHKGNESVEANIKRWTLSAANFHLLNDYHCGGFAKSNEELESFVREFSEEVQIPVEPVYTGKMFYGIFDLLKKDFFPKGSVIVALHTGGVF
jgi:1-aminocyclopropane-1-carboxylate deaminase